MEEDKEKNIETEEDVVLKEKPKKENKVKAVVENEISEVKKGFKGMTVLEKTSIVSLLASLFFLIIDEFIGLFFTVSARNARIAFGVFLMLSLFVSVGCFTAHCIKNKKIALDGTLLLFAITIIAYCL